MGDGSRVARGEGDHANACREATLVQNQIWCILSKKVTYIEIIGVNLKSIEPAESERRRPDGRDSDGTGWKRWVMEAEWPEVKETVHPRARKLQETGPTTLLCTIPSLRAHLGVRHFFARDISSRAHFFAKTLLRGTFLRGTFLLGDTSSHVHFFAGHFFAGTFLRNQRQNIT